MVDLTNLTDAAQLSNELQTLEAAVANLEAGGRIISMTVAPPMPPDGMPPPGVHVSMLGIDYPPEALKTALEARCAAILEQLTQFGFTGVDSRAIRKGK